MQRRDLLSLISLGPFCPTLVDAKSTPELWLANRYRPGVFLPDYWLSEKYDGIRGHWNGHQLLTQRGNTLTPPAWFTQNWPQTPFEGELWTGRGQFEKTASILQQKNASHEAWQQLRFMVFDLPHHPSIFSTRFAAYQKIVANLNQPWVQSVEQTRCNSHEELTSKLSYAVAEGSEGLMLHRADSHYVAGRSNDLLKVKPHDDAEAKVVGHVSGQGKYAHQNGALWVETPEGIRFKLGTGFSDAERKAPPTVGQWVTYNYRGLTAGGVPRFASFLRIHPDLEH
jgi:DNA ligase-1